MDINNVAIGKRLNSARKNIKMTMKEIGVLVNLHESSVQRYEAGLVKNVSIEKLKEFAKVLNIEASFLIGWEEIASTKEEDKNLDCFMNDIIDKLMKEGFIDDPNNISESVRTMIVNAVSLYVERKQRH